jgi:hypothetical protein
MRWLFFDIVKLELCDRRKSVVKLYTFVFEFDREKSSAKILV